MNSISHNVINSRIVSGYSNWLLHRSALLDTLSVRYRIAALVLALSFLGIVLFLLPHMLVLEEQPWC